MGLPGCWCFMPRLVSCSRVHLIWNGWTGGSGSVAPSWWWVTVVVVCPCVKCLLFLETQQGAVPLWRRPQSGMLINAVCNETDAKPKPKGDADTYGGARPKTRQWRCRKAKTKGKYPKIENWKKISFSGIQHSGCLHHGPCRFRSDLYSQAGITGFFARCQGNKPCYDSFIKWRQVWFYEWDTRFFSFANSIKRQVWLGFLPQTLRLKWLDGIPCSIAGFTALRKNILVNQTFLCHFYRRNKMICSVCSRNWSLLRSKLNKEIKKKNCLLLWLFRATPVTWFFPKSPGKCAAILNSFTGNFHQLLSLQKLNLLWETIKFFSRLGACWGVVVAMLPGEDDKNDMMKEWKRNEIWNIFCFSQFLFHHGVGTSFSTPPPKNKKFKNLTMCHTMLPSIFVLNSMTPGNTFGTACRFCFSAFLPFWTKHIAKFSGEKFWIWWGPPNFRFGAQIVQPASSKPGSATDCMVWFDGCKYHDKRVVIQAEILQKGWDFWNMKSHEEDRPFLQRSVDTV